VIYFVFEKRVKIDTVFNSKHGKNDRRHQRCRLWGKRKKKERLFFMITGIEDVNEASM